MKKDCTVLNNLTFIYLYIPTIIFLFGWCKYIVSIPLSFLLTIIAVKQFIDNKKYYSIDNIKNYIKNNKKQIIIILLISLLFVLLSGIGGYVHQNSDHFHRNTFLKELVTKDWPIFEDNGNIFFVYYFAIWLPAALVGKVFGLNIAFFFFYIWCVIGIFILFNYVKKFYKGNYLIPIIIFILFSGLDIVEDALLNHTAITDIIYSNHIEWSTGYQFSSFTTQLFWVFNQSIPAWLLTFNILTLKDNKIIGVLIAISLIFCTLPAFGLGIIALYKVFTVIKLNKKNLSKWFKQTFTWENIIVGIPLLLVFYTFVGSNAAGGKIFFGLTNPLINYYMTILFEVGIYYILVYKYNKKNPLYHISYFILFICPLISINGQGDFCMRASIPCLVLLYIFVLNALEESKQKKDKLIHTLLIITLAIGSITPINEIGRTIRNTKYYEGRKYVVLYSEDEELQVNFYGYTKDSLFYKYFMKK